MTHEWATAVTACTPPKVEIVGSGRRAAATVPDVRLLALELYASEAVIAAVWAAEAAPAASKDELGCVADEPRPKARRVPTASVKTGATVNVWMPEKVLVVNDAGVKPRAACLPLKVFQSAALR